jgi:hypothetical protein
VVVVKAGVRFIVAGGPCSCSASRYVRFAIPPGVAGAEAMVSCRLNGAEKGEITYHPFPAGYEYAVRVMPLSNVGEALS